ncbi:MAG: PEP-utilizing enzyme [Gordonia sp. (in: high G+C Gram-positive bacteria)]
MTTQSPTQYSGISSYAFGSIVGRIRNFADPADVIKVFDDDLTDVIALVASGGTTFLSPILGRLGGIICTSGTTRSHLAIVSREYGVPCLLAVDLHGWRPADGDRVRLASSPVGEGFLEQLFDSEVSPDPESSTGSTDAPATGGTGPIRAVTAADPVGRPYTTVTSGDEGTDWWNYIRTIGDDIACKPFPSSVTSATVGALCAQSLSDTDLNDLILHMGRAFKPEMTRRSGFTSEIFPMMPYMSLSVIEDFHTYPQRVRTIDAALPAEEIGRRLRQQPGLVSPLWIWMVGYHYLCGRELLIHMGRIAPDSDIDDVRTVVDFWRRLSLAHRGDGTLDYKDAGFTNRYLPDTTVADLRAQQKRLDATTRKELQTLNAALSGYCFMYFTDSRVGICDNGPYPAGDHTATLVRDFLSLDSGQFGYRWARDRDPGFTGVTLVLTFATNVFTEFEINDWGTTFTEPDQFLTTVTDAAVIGHRADGRSEVLPPETWAELTRAVGTEHLALYQQFSTADRNDRILAATEMYSFGLRPFARVAGVEDRIDWRISERTLALLPDPLGDDDQAGAIFGGALVAHDRPSAFSSFG